MKKENKEIVALAWKTLEGKWGAVVGTVFIVMLISMAASMIPKAGGLISLILTGPLTLGLVGYILAVSRGQEFHTDQVFNGFNRFSDAFFAYILVTIFVLLWALLLIVPGIIASISYSMTFFILADNPNIGAREAIKRSKSMMNGYKWKYVTLNLRFLGWAILCVLTLGIGFFWLVPYIQIAIAKFYDDIKDKSAEPSPAPTPVPAPQV